MASHIDSIVSRRQMLRASSTGFGYLALAGLACQESMMALGDETSNSPLAPRQPHFAPRAECVIFMFMGGGPSHVDTFDHKPDLERLATKGIRTRANGKRFPGQLMPSPWKFRRHGTSGLEISELFPNLAQHADDLCLINSMHTDSPAHPQATIFMHTGSTNFVRPSIGSWIVYGLGIENQNLPGFVSINPGRGAGGAQNYGSAFLPAAYQGTRISVAGKERPISNLQHPYLTSDQQRRHLDLIQSMNRQLQERSEVDTELDGVIESYELAFRMQTAVPDLMDISNESKLTRQAYGIGESWTDEFGRQCLMARRLAEAGVRFIEIAHPGWDQHNRLKTRLPRNCGAIDKPISALISDLKARGIFKNTLLVWTGEFGRTPSEQNSFQGRRHNNAGFTAWLAGGRTRGGTRFGATDEMGFDAVENKVHTHDLHATILHILGLDHQKLTYRYSGRDFRLTDVYGSVIHDILV